MRTGDNYVDNHRKLYSYCLMTNHVHLIVDPGNEADNLGRLMKRLAGKQTRYVNKLEKRTGSLWEGRYKSHPIENNEYLMRCCRYVELNPIRARMVDMPDKYRWSSYQNKIGKTALECLDFDFNYVALGSDDISRQKHYQALVEEGINKEEVKAIREALQYGRPYGSSGFEEEIENKLGIRLTANKRGRPCKKIVENLTY